jgi:hypothetical protein
MPNPNGPNAAPNKLLNCICIPDVKLQFIWGGAMVLSSAEVKKEARALPSADRFQGVHGLLLSFRTMCNSDANANQRWPKIYPEMGQREQSVLSRALRPILQGDDDDIGHLMHKYTVLSPQKREELLMQVRK